MSLRLYMDVHIPNAIADGLRRRGVDVLTAQEDASDTTPDSALLDRASSLGRVLFTYDDDLLVEAALRQVRGERFSGVIYAKVLEVSIGASVRYLELLAKVYDPEDVANIVTHLSR